MKAVIFPLVALVTKLMISAPLFSAEQGSSPASGPQAQDKPAINSATEPAKGQPAEGDPLKDGKEFLKKGDFSAAQEFFSAYLAEHPWNLEALFMNGNAALMLKQYGEAGRNFSEAIKQQPTLWAAHKNMVIVYAVQQKWAEFDRERAILQEARTKGSPGLSPKDADVIDVLYVGTERYDVVNYAELAGKYKMKYNFVHFGADGKPDRWIACESEDVDQGFFAERHPKEAALGKRSYSLDSYTAPAANGKGSVMFEHGTLKFYRDGEPSYETVRADVLAVLQHKTAPLSQSHISVPSEKPKE